MLLLLIYLIIYNDNIKYYIFVWSLDCNRYVFKFASFIKIKHYYHKYILVEITRLLYFAKTTFERYVLMRDFSAAYPVPAVSFNVWGLAPNHSRKHNHTLQPAVWLHRRLYYIICMCIYREKLIVGSLGRGTFDFFFYIEIEFQ